MQSHLLKFINFVTIDYENNISKNYNNNCNIFAIN